MQQKSRSGNTPQFQAARDGILSGLAVFLTALGSLIWLDSHASRNEEFMIRENLARMARAAAGLVDGDLHQQLTRPEQMRSAEYNRALDPLVNFHKGVPEIAYLYTLIVRENKFYFVLDTAVAADRLHFGRTLKPSSLMDEYSSNSPEEDEAEKEALRRGWVYVSKKAFSDEFGTFLTAVAPIRNSKGEIVGIVGLDTDVNDYLARQKKLQQASFGAVGIAALTGTLLGLLVWGMRRKSHRDLGLSEQKYQELVENLEQIVYQTDVRGHWVFLNPAWEKITGYTVKESLGVSYKKFVYENDVQAVRAARSRELSGADQGGLLEFRVRCKSGELRWLGGFCGPRVNETGEIVGTRGSLTDVSTRKKTEDALLAAKEAAEDAGRAKSEFLAVMSHEIRTPLNGLIGFADLLTETELTPAQREYVHTMRNCGDSLLHLLNDILDFSKMEAGHFPVENRPFSVRQRVSEVVALFSSSLTNRNLHLDVRYDDNVGDWIYGDGTYYRQVLVNLVSNAVKFTPHGKVTVHVGVDAQEPPTLRTDVVDTGIGIAPENIARLFRPFSQADSSTTRRYGGTGLGLAICARLLSLMGGRIDVTSTEGRGSCFSFWVPLKEATPEEIRAAEATSSVPPIMRNIEPRILIAEDNAVNRKVLYRMLDTLGLKADTVENGRKCHEAIKNRDYDIVFMDIQMPEMDGYETARKMRESGSKAWIIALTANAMPDDQRKCYAAGMNDYLSKPLKKDSLQAALERYFRAASLLL